MKPNKTIIFFSSLLVVLIFIYLIVVLFSKTKENDIKILKDDKTYFTLSNILSNEYQDDYYMDTQIIIDKVYFKNDEILSTYFIEAYQINRNFDENISFKDNLKYELTIQGVSYRVSEIDTDNLEEYAKSYELKNLDSFSNLVPSIQYDEKDKLVFYLSVYKNLLQANPIKAYNYLTDKCKQNYSNYQDFLNKADFTYDNIKTYINSYDKNKNKYIIYTDTKTITIIENNIMDFKIEY